MMTKMLSTTSTVLMVPPEGFQFNEQTAKSNAFQHPQHSNDVITKALNEFNDMVDTLRKHHINVLVMHQDKHLPDAVFPNNWFSTHLASNGSTNVFIYPMLTPNRQAEVNIEKLTTLLADNQIHVNDIVDLRSQTTKALEGTGSIIYDREHKLLYAALSERTDAEAVSLLAKQLGYQAIVFNASDEKSFPIYHTNVLMGLAEDFVIICLDAIKNIQERNMVTDKIKQSRKNIIDISLNQMGNMCGNVLALHNGQEKLLVMSSLAKQHFTTEQLNHIEQFNKVVSVDINTIESIGGGSARCMLAEIYRS